jgi:type VI secretion system FHA domain protein
MALVLSVLRCPDNAVPETRRLAGGELCIGRDPARAQWVLPDSTQQISRQHCTVRFDNGGWQVLDTSANGTFINQDKTPIGQGGARVLKDGDRIRIGPYEMEARVELAPRSNADAAFQSAPPAGGGFGLPADTWGGSLFPEHPAAADDPFGAPPVPSAFGQESIALPGSFLEPDPFAAPSTPPPPVTTPDHTPSFTDAFAPVRPLLSDDWAKEFEIGDPFAAPPPDPFAPKAHLDPFAAFSAPPPDTTPAPIAAPLFVADPFSGSPPAAPFPATPPAAPFAPAPPAAPFPAATPATASAPAAPLQPATDSALIAVFMEGAGLPDLAPKDPVAAMRNAGAAFRAFVTGLRELLIVRAEVKDTLGIDKTYIRARDNNPLKFSAGDDDALTALLGTGRRVSMAPAVAVAEALRDIRIHEQATLPAMQAAVRALLTRLDPEKIRAGVEGGIALPAQRRARAWEQYETDYARLTAALADEFDAVFGRRFSEEYQRMVADLRAAEPPL